MELQMQYLASLLVGFFLVLWMLVKKFRTKSTNSKLPPGPWKLPIIGNLHQMLGLPHHCLRDLAKNYGSGLMHLQLGQISTVIVSSPKVVKEMIKTHDLMFSDRFVIFSAKILTYNCKDLIFAPYGDYWRQLRKICILELLSAKRVQSFWSLREEEVSNLIQSISIKAGTPINMSERLFSLTNDITSRAAFGKKCKDKESFMLAMQEAIKLGGGFDIADLFPSLKYLHVLNGTEKKLERIHQKVDKILTNIIEDHRSTVTKTTKDEVEDLVDVLLKLQEGGDDLDFPITTENIKAVILDIFTAGSDTSSTALEWALSELVRNPRVMKKAQAEIRRAFHGKKMVHQSDFDELNYLKLVIKEALRLHPPAPLILPRECKETCEIDGYEIPMKTKVIINAWAIGRDQEHWRDAERFEPERFHGVSTDYKGNSFEFIPFGAGRRMCPGILFAIANIEIPLAQLLYHFDWTLPNGMKPEELDLSEQLGGTVRRKHNLYLIPTTCNPLIMEK